MELRPIELVAAVVGALLVIRLVLVVMVVVAMVGQMAEPLAELQILVGVVVGPGRLVADQVLLSSVI